MDEHMMLLFASFQSKPYVLLDYLPLGICGYKMSLDQTADTRPLSCIILKGHCFVLSIVDILFEEPHGI
jgi:hypothetical protein